MSPVEKAGGSQTVWKLGPDGKVRNHQTFHPNTNARNPNKWVPGNRTDMAGKAEFNKATKQWIDTPHTHDPTTPGGVRPALPEERPR